MTDVRLTATNPDDSSVVPVACNAKGELKLEEPIDNSFDGNLDGNLNVTGSAEFAGNVVVANDPLAVTAAGISLDKTGTIVAGNGDGNIFYGVNTSGGTSDITSTIRADGSAEFAGPVTGLSFDTDPAGGGVRAYRSIGGSASVFRGGRGESDITSEIFADGSVRFAGGNAGITKEGNLYVKTVRGNIVMLDAVSNGLGSWMPYEPPSRKNLVQEKLEEWSEKDKPGISSQESDENPQIRI